MKPALTIIALSFILPACTNSLYICTPYIPYESCTPRFARGFINWEQVNLIKKRVSAVKCPQHVAFFSPTRKPISPYRMVGLPTLSKYNWRGIAQKPKTLQAMMKNLVHKWVAKKKVNFPLIQKVAHSSNKLDVADKAV